MRAWTVLYSPGEGMIYATWLSRLIRKGSIDLQPSDTRLSLRTIHTDVPFLRVLFNVFFHSFSDAEECQPDHFPSLLVVASDDILFGLGDLFRQLKVYLAGVRHALRCIEDLE